VGRQTLRGVDEPAISAENTGQLFE